MRQNLLTLRFLWLACRRRPWLVVGGVLLGLLGGGFLAWRLPFTYVSEAEILIQPGVREQFSVEAGALQGTPVLRREHFTDVANTLALLRSRTILDRIVERLVAEGFRPPGPPPRAPEKRASHPVKAWLKRLLKAPPQTLRETPAEAIRYRLRRILAAALELEQLGGTTVVRVRARWKDPQTAYRLASLYLEESQRFYREFHRHRESVASLEKLAAATERKLAELDHRENEIRAEFDVTDVEAEVQQVLAQLARLEEEHAQCQLIMAEANARRKSLAARLQELPRTLPRQPTVAVNPKWRALYTQIQNLKLRKLQSPSLKGSSPIDREIARLEAELAREPIVLELAATTPPNPVYTALEQQLLSLEAQAAGAQEKCGVIQRELQVLRARYQTLQRVQKALVALERERRLLEEELRNYKRTLQAARAAELLTAGRKTSLVVLQAPEQPREPARNRRLLALLLGLLAGLCLGGGAAFASAWRRRPVTSASELAEEAGVPVLAVVSLRRRRMGFQRLLSGGKTCS